MDRGERSEELRPFEKDEPTDGERDQVRREPKREERHEPVPVRVQDVLLSTARQAGQRDGSSGGRGEAARS